jgi:cytochrome c-type biogenesis protein CcmF
VALPWLVYGGGSALTVVGVVAGVWLVLASLRDPLERLRGRGPLLTRGVIGMQIAHLGLGLTVLGITISSAFSIITDQRIAPGESLELGEYRLFFAGVAPVEGGNYTGVRANMEISRDGKAIARVYPEKRLYTVRSAPMTEAGIHAGWHRDLFVALGEDLGNGAWSVRLQYKPLVRFIWLGAVIMAFGGMLAMTDRRYRVAAHQGEAVSASAGATQQLQ